MGKTVHFKKSKFHKGLNSYKKLTQIDKTPTWSKVNENKLIYKISTEYVKRMLQKSEEIKTVYFQYSKFQKGHNSYKNCWKLLTLELDMKFIICSDGTIIADNRLSIAETFRFRLIDSFFYNQSSMKKKKNKMNAQNVLQQTWQIATAK